MKTLTYNTRSTMYMLQQHWNTGSLCGNGGEACEYVRKRMIDVCCLQEVRWRDRLLVCLGWNEGYLCCGGLKMKMGLDKCQL